MKYLLLKHEKIVSLMLSSFRSELPTLKLLSPCICIEYQLVYQCSF